MRAKAAGKATITFTTEEGAKTATLTVTVTERESSGNGTVTIVDKNAKYDDEILTLIGIEHTVLSKNRVNLVFTDSDGNGKINLIFSNSLSNGRLAAGNYTCTNPASDVNNTLSSNCLGQYGFCNKGSVNVTIAGDNYTITMNNVETTNGYTFNGSYTGKLTYTNQYVDVASVSLNESILAMTIGNYYYGLTATVLPDDAFNKNVTWSSTNPDVVAVDERGVLNAKTTGTATITVTTEDGAKTATCIVTVNSIPSTGNGTFSNNNGKLINIKRATQLVNGKDPKEITLNFYKENSTGSSMSLTLTRDNGDTGALKAGTYKTIYTLEAGELDVKYSYQVTGTVTANGEQYSVNLDVTDEHDVKITGNYSGKIQE